jgi:NAD(P)-dependent dehydrogenase (short-subunit alcohol dehydrogenase family)
VVKPRDTFDDVLDRILDAAVLPGYTNVGYRLRRHAWNDAELERMDDRVVLVTGATSGLGLAAAAGLARLGASVRLLARSAERAEQARAKLVERTAGTDVEVVLCDLSDLGDIRRFTAEFLAGEPRLDVLINNAGVLPAQRAVTADGLELTFATNVAAPFLLTKLLLGRLRSSAPSRIVNVTSGGMYTRRVHVEDLQMERGEFDGTVAYARTKRAEMVLTELWAQRLAGSGVVVHAMHPGWADTPGVRASLPTFHRLTRPLLRTPEQAPTRSSGWRRPPSPRAAPAVCGTTGAGARRTGSPRPASRPTSARRCGRRASNSPATTKERPDGPLHRHPRDAARAPRRRRVSL